MPPSVPASPERKAGCTQESRAAAAAQLRHRTGPSRQAPQGAAVPRAAIPPTAPPALWPPPPRCCSPSRPAPPRRDHTDHRRVEQRKPEGRVPPAARNGAHIPPEAAPPAPAPTPAPGHSSTSTPVAAPLPGCPSCRGRRSRPPHPFCRLIQEPKALLLQQRIAPGQQEQVEIPRSISHLQGCHSFTPAPKARITPSSRSRRRARYPPAMKAACISASRTGEPWLNRSRSWA